MQFGLQLPNLGSSKLSHAVQVAGGIWARGLGCASGMLH